MKRAIAVSVLCLLALLALCYLKAKAADDLTTYALTITRATGPRVWRAVTVNTREKVEATLDAPVELTLVEL